jgi:hypothetical protein
MSNPVIKLDFPNPQAVVVDRKRFFDKQILRLLIDVVRRLGGQRADFVQQARATSLETEAMVRALLAGAPTGYTLTPSNPLGFASTSTTEATISVAAHTRSSAASTIAAGSITGVTRGAVYYVFYSDAGNLGGAVTFVASSSVADATAAGMRIVGAIYVEPTPPTGGTEA